MMKENAAKLARTVLLLVKRDFKSKYVGTVIGFYWSVLNPLVLLIIYTTIFSVILKIKIGAADTPIDFGFFLFCGMLPWLAIQNTLQFSATTFMENAKIINQIPLPLAAFPLSVTLSSLIYELIAVVVFTLALIIKGTLPGASVVYFPIVLLAQVVMMTGLSLFLASLNVFFRDVSQFVSAFMIVWFFATPIVYPLALLPPQLRLLASLNPLTHLVSAYRAIFLNTHPISLNGIVIFSIFSAIIFLAGLRLFQKTAADVVDEI